MSKIDGLTVQGVRSFAPDHREVLSLYTPLTLIVGSNGSGKTTVIECLKYATTGDLPPNTKNGAFIHDPKLCNEKLVLANVGLKFTSIGGVSHVLHRKMQVTVAKNGKFTFKTLESSLKSEGHDTHTASHRTKVADEEVCNLLGVSSAILDSVIFCHQDESLWPMSEPSALKKKFDEIFEAQKYTKVIEQLKLIRKKRGEALRLSLVTLKEDEKNMTRAKENSKAIHALTADINRMQQECTVLEERIASLEEKEMAKREEANEFLGIVNNLAFLQEQFKNKSENSSDLRQTMTIMPEEENELKSMLDQSDARLKRLQGLVEEDEAEHRRLGLESNELHVKLNAKLAEQGRLESDKEKYTRQLQKRIEMIQQAATKHGIRGFSNELDEAQVEAFNDKIHSMFNIKKKEHERAEKDLTRAADEARHKIEELETKKITLTSARTSAKARRADNDRRIKRLQTQADGIDCDEGRVTILEKQTAASEERHQTTEKDFGQGDWDGKIEVAKSELAELQNKRKLLNTELVNFTRLLGDRAQLDVRKKQLRDEESHLENLEGTYSDRISSLVRCAYNVETVGSDYKSVFDGQTAIVKEEQRKCDALSRELNQREFALAEAKKRQSASVETKNKYEKSVLKALKKVVDADAAETVTVDDFETQYEEIENDKDVLEKDLNLFDKMKNFYAESQTYLHTKNKCRLCDRGFEDEQAKSKLMKKIAKGLDDKMKEEIQKGFDEVDEKYTRLSAVRADHDALQRLNKEISGLKKEVDEATRKREEKLYELEAAEQQRAKAEEALSEIESVSKRVSEITQMHAKVLSSRVETGRLQSQSQLSGIGRSADEIQDALRKVEEHILEATKKSESLTAERQRLLSLITSQARESERNADRLEQAKQQMSTKTSLFKEIKSLKDDNQTQDAELVGIDQEIKALQPRIDAARGQRDAELERGREKSRLVAEERDTIASTVNSLKLIEADIKDYEDHGKATSLLSCERAIESLKQQRDRLKTDMGEVQKRINSETKELGDGAHRKRNIQDNLRFRKDQRDLDELKSKIDELDTHNAREDYDKRMRDVRKYEDQRTKLTAERHTIAGNMAAKDETLKEKHKSHETFFKGARAAYKQMKINVETNKAAIDDVATTSNAVDKAVMHYHSLKMEEINRIANELWRATYKGTDIDTIAIRSENETPSATSTSTARKQYNYRVTMVKSDTEMDMRGRCSAGQKVLASIIIRLALAESFGINCGLIALDEPTTNLDSENIKSLATSLHGIIKARQAQANFQLIVITHDEEFLRYMRCNEFCDFFYRVARDRDQKSTITKDDISRITE